jgi:hypothetical protein
VVIDDDSDPYDAVREWWDTAPLAYKTPREDLFEDLGIPRDAIGLYHVGRGVVLRESVSPAALSYRADGADYVRKAARRAAAAVGLKWKETDALVLRRGPYVIAAGLDESVPGGKPFSLRGRFIDLFDANLPVLREVLLKPGRRVLLFDLDSDSDREPRVLAAACRVRNEHVNGKTLSFQAEGIGDTEGVVRCAAPSAPAEVLVGGEPINQTLYDSSSRTLLLRFPNSVSPVQIEVRF